MSDLPKHEHKQIHGVVTKPLSFYTGVGVPNRTVTSVAQTPERAMQEHDSAKALLRSLIVMTDCQLNLARSNNDENHTLLEDGLRLARQRVANNAPTATLNESIAFLTVGLRTKK